MKKICWLRKIAYLCTRISMKSIKKIIYNGKSQVIKEENQADYQA